MPQPAVSAIDRKPGLGPARESGGVWTSLRGREEEKGGAFQGERAAKAEGREGCGLGWPCVSDRGLME